MKYVEAFSLEHPAYYRSGPLGNIQPGEISLFLGGGITGCRDWQAEIVEKLKDTDLVLLNPRRKHWPMNDPSASKNQIEWEYEHLQTASMIMFWFSPETLCPITLFEYGKWIVSNKPLFIGCDPEYKRLEDVKTQTRLERPYQKVFTDLDSVVGSILLHTAGNTMSL